MRGLIRCAVLAALVAMVAGSVAASPPTTTWSTYRDDTIFMAQLDSLIQALGPAASSEDSLDYRMYLSGLTDTTWADTTAIAVASGGGLDSVKQKFGGKMDHIDIIATQAERLRVWEKGLDSGLNGTWIMVIDAGVPFHYEGGPIDSTLEKNLGGAALSRRSLARGHKNR